MASKFIELAFTDSVRRAQEKCYGATPVPGPVKENDRLTPDEVAFIELRDSFYLSSVSETGWPYVQHRGGAIGFLRVIDESRLAFADYKGNRQLLTTGNVAMNDRVCLFLMDYPRRTRLKILGRVRVVDAREDAGLVEQVAAPELRGRVERVFLIEVVGYDWNCPKYITPRFTAAEVAEAVKPLRERIALLEAELAATREAVSTQERQD